MAVTKLVDRFGRQVNYVRLSVTDRCDFRCVYCMAEDMTFVPRTKVLTLEEMTEVAHAFVSLGVEKIRLTGGEPLVRRDVLKLCQAIGRMSLKELTMTTNGARLVEFAEDLRASGMRRINISLDSLSADRFKELTRIGELNKVLAGVEAARKAGFERIKLNAVIMKNRNDDEVVELVKYALERNLDISFIEEMPLGMIEEHDRQEAFCSSAEIRDLLAPHYQLMPTTRTSAGPSRYYQVDGFSGQIGFISPHSHNFCGDCNRVRVTAEGRLLLCLGNEHSLDLRAILRSPGYSMEILRESIIDAMQLKPEKHDFRLDETPQILRFMNATGG